MSKRTFEHLIPVELDFRCENARIVAIDDEKIMTRFVEACLKNEGFHEIVSFNDPQEAFENLESIQPDLILLDIAMPGINGLDLLEKIRENESFNDVPVVMLSASAKRSKYKALNLGAIDFINKPFEQSDLVNAVRNALRVV